MTETSTNKPTAIVLRECSICQSSIFPSEKTIACPKCNLVFHSECWEANLGCAAYGCEAVDMLKPTAPEPAAEQLPPPIEHAIERLPWDFLLLGASTLAMAASTITYGVPSACALVLVARRMWMTRDLKHPIRVAALAACVVGIVVGVLVSRLWWFRDYTS